MSRPGFERPVSTKLRWRVEMPASSATSSWVRRRRSRHSRSCRPTPGAASTGRTLARPRRLLHYPEVIDSATRARHHPGMKLAGGAGVLGFALATFGSAGMGVFGAASLFEFPGTKTSAAELASFVAAHRTAALAAMVLNTLAVALWLVFGAGVWLRLRRGGEDILSATFAIGFAAFATLIFAGFVPFFVLVYRGGDPDDARLLYDLTFGMLALSGAPTAVALGAYAAHVWHTRRLPRWTAVLAGIGAGAHVVLLASFLVGDGFFSLEGQVITAIPATLFIWVLGTGIAMWTRPTPVAV